MINPYYILRDELLSILLEHSIYTLNQWGSLPTAPQVRESCSTLHLLIHTVFV